MIYYLLSAICVLHPVGVSLHYLWQRRRKDPNRTLADDRMLLILSQIWTAVAFINGTIILRTT